MVPVPFHQRPHASQTSIAPRPIPEKIEGTGPPICNGLNANTGDLLNDWPFSSRLVRGKRRQRRGRLAHVSRAAGALFVSTVGV